MRTVAEASASRAAGVEGSASAAGRSLPWATRARCRRALLAWFDRNGRDLPWRRRRDPYRVWVSEVMLQQTRAEVVAEAYGRFLARFPTLSALAGADLDDVLTAWSGLGYYRRARLLHAGARAVEQRHGGRLPAEPARLRRIPGIGEYTAAAIASIAFGSREAAVDANVARVWSRVLALDVDAKSGGGRAALRQAAAGMLDRGRPGDFNEALMDLGSQVCRARAPDCGACPLRRLCRARRLGCPEDYPARTRRTKARVVRLAVAVVRMRRGRQQCVLLARRGEQERLLAGMWDLPSVEVAPARSVRARLSARVLAAGHRRVRLSGPVASVRHAIVGRDIRAEVYLGELPAAGTDGGAGANGVAARFFAPCEMESIALPSLPRKVLRALDALQAGARQ